MMNIHTRRLVLKLVRYQNRVEALEQQASETYNMDSAFDGGEFSGPAINRQLERDIAREALRIGFNSPAAAAMAADCLRCDIRATVGAATYGCEGMAAAFGFDYSAGF